MFQVDKDVPIPDKLDSIRKYPFSQMEIGDSFSFDKRKERTVSTAAYFYGRRTSKKFTVRKVETNLWRCWRIAPPSFPHR